MGQVNSAAGGEGGAGVENGCRPVMPGNLDLSLRSNNPQEEQVKCVKARIDMLIEDCLNKEQNTDSESEKSPTTKIPIKPELSAVNSGSGNENGNRSTIKSDSKDVADRDNVDENVKNEGDVGAKAGNEALKSDSQEQDTGKDECTVTDEKCVQNKENVRQSEHGSVTNEMETNKSESSAANQQDQVKVADIISDMVNTEINQSHLNQLQKRTITTFNTFIDKVLDSTLQQEMKQEEPKTSEPSIIQLFTESLLPANEQPNRKESPKSEVPRMANTDGGKNQTKQKITLKDHIEKFLEQSIHHDGIEAVEKKPPSGKFNAQGLLDTIIVEGLKMNSSSGSKEKLKIESPKCASDSYSQKPLKPYSVNETSLQVNTSVGGDISRRRSPVPNRRDPSNDSRSSRPSHHSSDQGPPMMDQRYKEMYMKPGRPTDMRGESREMYNHSGFQGQGRRHSLSERSREATGYNPNNKQFGTPIPSSTESVSAFHHLHSMYAGSDFMRAAYSAAAMGGLSPGQTLDPRFPVQRENKAPNYHPRDCACALCVQSARPKLEQAMVEPQREKHSPHIPPHLIGLQGQYRDPSQLIRPGLMPAMYSQYPNKVMSYHPSVASPKETNHSIPTAGDFAMTQGRKNIANGPVSPHYMYKRSEESAHYDRMVKQQAVTNASSARPPSGHKQREKEFIRAVSSQSVSSEGSDSPLDLSVKKPKVESLRHRSASFNVSSQRRGSTPMNTFIKHLESSVDKHWQEMNSPSSSPGNSSSPKGHLLTPPETMSHASYHSHSPNPVDPSAQMAMLHNRHLPSPHYAGGITVGQPLVNLERHQVVTESQYPSASQYDGFPPSSQSQQFSSQQVQPHSFDNNRQQASADVSKHEPIQNIIGNHDPNDILYLICRLCTQTYGSPYAFRKHFRSNHGFEPRSDHTIVQTISATKRSLHIPQPMDVPSHCQVSMRLSPHDRPQLSMSQHDGPHASMSPHGAPALGAPRRTSSQQVAPKPQVSSPPRETKSHDSSEDGEIEPAGKVECMDKHETKCLECPECGKTFQLNDFGSYKRHCRQHGNLLTSGPFTCTDCHLHFPDQKALREHYLQHVKGTTSDQREAKINDSSIGDIIKTESHSHHGNYSCVKCNAQFDNMNSFSKHLSSHDSGDESPQANSVDNNVLKRKDPGVAQMDISVNTVSSPSGIVKQAAESMTAQMCPDSSWDNVVKGDVTSNKPDDVSSENSEPRNSPGSNGGIVNRTENNKSENSPMTRNMDMSSDASDANTQDSADMGIYKHKKFFHHRKRANSNLTQESPEPKQAKLNSDSNSAQMSVSNTRAFKNVNKDTCDSSGFSHSGSTSSVASETARGSPKNAADKKEDKAMKTEARHNLPFVWDRPTRSQKKL